jgi:hemerythrin
MMYGYTTVSETIDILYDQMQHWLTEHMATQEQNYSTIIIDSLDVPDLEPTIAESYTDTIERIRRNMR